jgi:hypothetical protein
MSRPDGVRLSPYPRSRQLAAAGVASLLALWALSSLVTPAAAQSGAQQTQVRPQESRDGRTDAARGLVYRGLVRKVTGKCRGGWELEGQPGICTAGPDPAPAGVDVREAGGRRPKPGASTTPSPTPSTSASPSPSPTATPTTGPWCGSDGSRVQLIFARAADVADRYSTLASSLQQYAAAANKIFLDSAAQTGGVRRIRYVTDANCVPVIVRATLTTTGDDSFTNTRTELKAQGFTRTDRKYLVWVDAGVYCGIANVAADDTPGQTNKNNVGPTFGRVDRSCWGGRTEAHELTHTLGGVQLSAPHTSGAWHCTDDYDRMCYKDGAKAMTYPCLSGHEALLDCGHDDYFHTRPDASNYLATHWNVANSAFLWAGYHGA